MPDPFVQLENLLGHQKAERLSKARIALFGLGAAGAVACEALARCGVASLTLVDDHLVRPDDISHHPAAFSDSVGQSILMNLKKRIARIDEGILVHTYEMGVSPETVELFDFRAFDYVIESLENVREKQLVIEKAQKLGVPLVSCMSTSGLTDAGRLEAADISRSTVCPMAKELKAELKKAGIRKLRAVFSRERPRKAEEGPSGIVFVPFAAGVMLAQEAVKSLTEEKKEPAGNTSKKSVTRKIVEKTMGSSKKEKPVQTEKEKDSPDA